MNSEVDRSDSSEPTPDIKPRRRARRLLRFRLASMLIAVLLAGIFFQRFERFYAEYLRDRDMIVPTDFDAKTGKNIRWRARTGSVSWRGPVLSGDKIFLGTNNEAGYLQRYPSNVDLGVLLCLRMSDGKFLWQASNHKLATGRRHDWPLQGVTSVPTVEGDRLCDTDQREQRALRADEQGIVFHHGQPARKKVS